MASGSISGIASSSASAMMTTSGSCDLRFSTSAFSSNVNNYAEAYSCSAGPSGNLDFILFQVTASPGEVATSGQLNYGLGGFHSSMPDWDTSLPTFVITVNGDPVPLNKGPFWAGGVLNVEIGDIIGLECDSLADNLSHYGDGLVGSTDVMADAYLYMDSVGPVPLPPTALLFGSVLLGLVGWRLRKG